MSERDDRLKLDIDEIRRLREIDRQLEHRDVLSSLFSIKPGFIVVSADERSYRNIARSVLDDTIARRGRATPRR